MARRSTTSQWTRSGLAAFCVTIGSGCWVDENISPLDEPQPVADAGVQCADGWCRIPAGSFVMGSPTDEPFRGLRDEDQVDVTFTRDFEIGQFEVTQGEWKSQGLENPSSTSEEDGSDCIADDCPVGTITWFDAVEYTNLLSEHAGLPACYVLAGCAGAPGERNCESVELSSPSAYDCTGYRLPTEAEWEYAVRAGTTTTFYGGDISHGGETFDCLPDTSLVDIAWFCHNSGGTTHPVGGKEPNSWNLFDMTGNVREWTHSRYTAEGYGDGPLIDPGGELVDLGTMVMRGGSFLAWGSICRSAFRNRRSPSITGPGFGFRVARTIHEPAE